ncbi:MAG: metal-dependent hydrolase [Nannocystaceae bacterium]|nr:metal-dependent hydrolase [Nannocystaceae bacterium]
MASLGHILVGLAAARVAEPAAPLRARLYTAIGLATLSLLPDLDVIAFRLGIPYEAPLGHRGASHSLVAAVVIGIVVAAMWRPPGRSRLRTTLLCTAVVASHGLLDMCTDGGEGVALLWPFSDARMFFGWQPLPVAPIGRGMLSARGLHVLTTELLWFAPLLLFGLWPPRTPAPARAP